MQLFRRYGSNNLTVKELISKRVWLLKDSSHPPVKRHWPPPNHGNCLHTGRRLWLKLDGLVTCTLVPANPFNPCTWSVVMVTFPARKACALLSPINTPVSQQQLVQPRRFVDRKIE